MRQSIYSSYLFHFTSSTLKKIGYSATHYRGGNYLRIKDCYQTKLVFVCLTHSKANQLTRGCSAGKYKVYCRVPSKETRKIILKRPKFPDEFQQRIFKESVRERVMEYMTSSCIILRLVDGEVTGWDFRNLNYQFSSSNWSKVYILVVNIQLTSSTRWEF